MTGEYGGLRALVSARGVGVGGRALAAAAGAVLAVAAAV